MLLLMHNQWNVNFDETDLETVLSTEIENVERFGKVEYNYVYFEATKQLIDKMKKYYPEALI